MEKKISIGKINGTEIFAISSESGELLVPIKPICEILGISSSSQYKKLNSDIMFSKGMTLIKASSRDGKKYEMLCLPLNRLFGWLFSINPRNVGENARMAILRFRYECCDLMYCHFTEMAHKQISISEAELGELRKIDDCLGQEKELRARIRLSRKRINEIRLSNQSDKTSFFM